MTITHQLERFPFPIAHPARALVVARDPADRLERAAHFVEMCAITLGIVALGWCGARAISSPATARWQQALGSKGAALGGWIALLEGVDTVLADHPNDPVARSMHLAVESLVPLLKKFVEVRNRYAHGGRPRVRGDMADAARDLTEHASRVLDRIEPLTSLRLGVVRSCRKRPQDRPYDIDLDMLAGYAELFAQQRLRSRHPFEDGAVLAYSSGSLGHAVDLTPYCVWRRCAVCGHDELFYLTKRKPKRSDYYSFSTGHHLRLDQNVPVPTPEPVAQMGMAPLGSRRAAAAHGWRASWTDLAPRHRRLAARAVDAAAVGAATAAAWLPALSFGLPILWWLAPAVLIAAAYEPVSALVGGTIGKRLMRIEAISVWDCRPPGRRDSLLRAFAFDIHLVFPPLAARNLAWLLWDPARQCQHDRWAGTIVVAGRSRSAQKR